MAPFVNSSIRIWIFSNEKGQAYESKCQHETSTERLASALLVI